MTQTDFKDSVDSRIDSWTIQEYGNHGKIAIKFSNEPFIKKIDTKNISDYFKMALATLDVQHGMLLSLDLSILDSRAGSVSNGHT